MINLISDFHTHTVFSHGTGTIEANAMSALKSGMKALAITDHGLAHLAKNLKKREIKIVREQVDKLNARLNGSLRVLLGIEANLISLDGTIDLPENLWGYFDMVVVGYHSIAHYKNTADLFKMYIRNAIPKITQKLIESNTGAFLRAIEKYKIDILTHPGHKMPVDVKQVAQCAAAYGTAMEINCKHERLTVEEAKIANEQGVMFAIGSDAHTPEDVGNFTKGIMIAQEAGISADRIVNSDSVMESFAFRNCVLY